MRRTLSLLPTAAALAILLLPASRAAAGEGKWTPAQVAELGPEWLRDQGFERPLDRLWDAEDGTGLLANAVKLPGCSGSFVSSEGLLITNHHCVVDILVEHSTPDANLVREGFLARMREDEKKAAAYPVLVPRAFRDVTPEVEAAVSGREDDLDRFRAMEATGRALVAECEKEAGTRCEFASYDGGLLFTLTEYRKLDDVRLVYAPPESVGNFGGEVDNWSWPRHGGDFALLRVHDDDGRPYRPRHVFPLSTRGVGLGDAVALLGYPGTTYRSWLADEMREREHSYFPARSDLYREWIGVLEEESARSANAAIALADERRTLENRKKNADGQVEGLRRGHIVEKQRAAEERVVAWAAERPEWAAALAARKGILALEAERERTWTRDFLLDEAALGPWGLRWPLTLARRATEAEKKDAEREPGYMERDLALLRRRLAAQQKQYEEAADRKLFLSWVTRALALPEGERVASVDAAFVGARDSGELERRIARLYVESRVFDSGERAAMFDEPLSQLRARQDPLLDLALALDGERRELKTRRDTRAGALLRLRPAWRHAVLAAAGRPLAMDANRTLRVTFGRVRGYSPREAVAFAPRTTLAGAVAKYTGEDPFDLPARVRDAFAAGRVGRWADPELGQVPVDFLADCDTTGGNSGSPVIDARGRLVGVNFDRVWENVANDFGYNPDIARNVSADVRYLLWLLEEIDGAPELVREMTAAE